MSNSLYQQAERVRAAVYPTHKQLLTAAPVPVVKLVAEGDSWFSYFPPYDIIATLRNGTWNGRRYDIKGAPRAGSYLNEMVYHPRQLADTFEFIRTHRPAALLFSGGGNDIAGPELFDFLWNKSAGGGPHIVNARVVAGVIDDVFRQGYVDFVEAVRQCATDAGLPGLLPVVCHGYGYAIPDGRGWAGGWGPLPGPWLDPSLNRKNWDRDGDATIRRTAIRTLIDAFNQMLAGLAGTLHGFHYVDLRAVLADADWGNELHPTEAGFEKVTAAIEAKLRQVVP